MKVCTACLIAKPLECFHNEAASKDGKKPRCKQCISEYSKTYFYKNHASQLEKGKRYKQENKDSISLQKKESYANNKASESLRAKRYRQKNLAKLIDQVKAYREKNREVLRANNRQYHKEHPYVGRNATQRRRARLKQAIPIWADRVSIRAVYKKAADLERLTGRKFHVDHIVPLHSEFVCGLHVFENLRIVEPTENLQKSNKFSESLAVVAPREELAAYLDSLRAGSRV